MSIVDFGTKPAGRKPASSARKSLGGIEKRAQSSKTKGENVIIEQIQRTVHKQAGWLLDLERDSRTLEELRSEERFYADLVTPELLVANLADLVCEGSEEDIDRYNVLMAPFIEDDTFMSRIESALSDCLEDHTCETNFMKVLRTHSEKPDFFESFLSGLVTYRDLHAVGVVIATYVVDHCSDAVVDAVFASNTKLPWLRLLYDRGANVENCDDSSALWNAVKAEVEDLDPPRPDPGPLLEFLLGIEQYPRDYLYEYDGHPFTEASALHVTASRGSVALGRALLRGGCDPWRMGTADMREGHALWCASLARDFAYGEMFIGEVAGEGPFKGLVETYQNYDAKGGMSEDFQNKLLGIMTEEEKQLVFNNRA